MRTCVKFMFVNKIEAMHERSLVSVKVERRSTSRLISTLYILPLFSASIKNASVEINPQGGSSLFLIAYYMLKDRGLKFTDAYLPLICRPHNSISVFSLRSLGNISL